MANIMNMKNGTRIRNKQGGTIFILGDYEPVNKVARKIWWEKYPGEYNYINENTQDEYEVVE